MSPHGSRGKRDNPEGLNRKKRYLAVLVIPCREHPDHVLTLSSSDDVAHIMGDFLMGELPFENMEQEQYVVSTYSPYEDLRDT